MKPPKPASAKRLTAITPPANAVPFTEWVCQIGYSKESGQLWRRKGIVQTFHHPNTEKGKVFIHTAEAKRFLAVLSGEKTRTITPPASLIEKELEDFRYAAVSLHSPALSTITGSQPWQIPPDDDWRADYRRAWSKNPPLSVQTAAGEVAAVKPEFSPAARWPFSKFWHIQHDRTPQKTHLAEVVHTIRTSTHIARQIMELRECLPRVPHAYAGQKMHLPAVAFGGVFSGGHKATQLTRYSGLIVIAVKNMTADQLAEVRSKLVQDKRLVALFVSPSGTGLKCLFWTRRPAADHQLVWSDIVSGVSSLTGLPIISGSDVASINASGRSVNSLCFLSHDPEAVYHHEAEEWFVLAGDPSDAGKIVE